MNTCRLGYLAAAVALVAAVLFACPGVLTRFSPPNVAHDFGYEWNTQLLALHIVSNSLIGISYFVISTILAYVVHHHRRQVPFSGTLIASCIFIGAAAFTHLMDTVLLWHPLFWLAGEVKLIAALAAVSTAIAMLIFVPQFDSALTEIGQSRLNERRFLAASNSSLDSFFIFESVRDEAGKIYDFRFAFVNENGAALCSSTAKDLIGKLLCETFPVYRSAGFFEKYKKVVETGVSLIDESPVAQAGIKATWLHLHVVKLNDGVAVTSSNISERIWFLNMIEALPSAVAMTDEDGKMEMVNAEMEHVFGYPRSELLGKSIDLLMPERFRNGLVQEERETKARRNLIDEDLDQFYGLRKDGTEFPILIRLNRVEMTGGKKVVSAITDVSEDREKKMSIQAALKEKDVLLGEIHHRVKNNLQIVHSLLDLQSAQIQDPLVVAMLQDSQHRIRSMALIHQTLYQSKDFANVDFGMFLESLAPNLLESYLKDSARIALSIHAPDMHLPINAAIPCGLLVNELISNCLKHAFPNGRRGKIDIRFVHDEGGQAQLSVVDDGVGIPDGLDMMETASLGLQLVFLLTEQLGGKMTVHRSGPTGFVLRFPVKEAKPHQVEDATITHLPEFADAAC
ncbi:MAG TPA: histidine kinase dimerization/phosphoacceptor domain -containing protein [Acidisarcina sp.]